MKPKIALSTCWCSHRHTDGYEMAREISEIGFRYVELSHGIRISLVPGILKALEEGIVEVVSVHNFCPLPTGIMGAAPNIYEPTSPDRIEREQWLRHTRRTIEFANRVGADRAVLHSGSVRFFWRHPDRVINRYLESRHPSELKGDATYERLLEKILARMRAKERSFMERLKKSFGEVIPFAKENGVMLGVENREGVAELPLDGDLGGLLDEFNDSETLYYWHDSGHAQLKERMGIVTHEQLLLENNKRLIGFHLHDVNEQEMDHQPIGTGTIDFQMIRNFIRPEQVIVIELNPRLKAEAVIASRGYLNKLLEGV